MFKQTACVLALSLVAASPASAATVTRFSVKGATVSFALDPNTNGTFGDVKQGTIEYVRN